MRVARPVGLTAGGALASLRADGAVGFLLERSFSIFSMVWWTRFPKLLFVLFSFNARIGPGMPPDAACFGSLNHTGTGLAHLAHLVIAALCGCY
jgi:hypothetical protein